MQGKGILKESVSSLVVWGDVQDAPAYVWVRNFEAVFVCVVGRELGESFLGAVLDATPQLLVVFRDGAGVVVILDSEKIFVALRVLESQHAVRIEEEFFPHSVAQPPLCAVCVQASMALVTYYKY